VLLAIDIGNSTLKAAAFRSAAAPTWVHSAATHREMTADELEIQLRDLLSLGGQGFADVTGIAVASVVPQLADALEAVGRRLSSRPVLVASAANLPLPIRLDHPDGVGTDRLVDAYAAHRLFGGPLVVVDVGTAITVDAVGGDGAFLGGAIAAGPALALRALAEHTARLPRVPLVRPARVIGRDTASALQAGATFGWQDLVNGLIRRVRAELAAIEGLDPARIRTVLTGGHASGAVGDGLDVDIVDEQLTLKGLALFYGDVVGFPAEGAR
jgi:type III pantothenate kinase